MTELKKITEENFIDAFDLMLAPEQEEFVSHRSGALPRLMFTGISASHSGSMLMER